MAIKNKVKADMYGEDSKNPLAVEKVKPLAFAGIKQLVKQGYDVKTSFFVKADYYKSADGKSEGHFLAIGDSPALEKKFKREKTAPDVAYGNIFVKDDKGKETAYFEYVNGQGKLKKPADWKGMLKVFKKMLKMPCVFVVDGEMVQDEEDSNEDVTTSTNTDGNEDPAERLERKAKIAEELMLEVVEIKKVYDRDKKEKLLKKTTKWLNEYNALDASEQTPELKSHLPKVQEAYKTVQHIIKIDNQITNGMDQIHAGLKKYLGFKDYRTDDAKKIATQLRGAIDKLKPFITEVKDSDLLESCNSIQELLAR